MKRISFIVLLTGLNLFSQVPKMTFRIYDENKKGLPGVYVEVVGHEIRSTINDGKAVIKFNEKDIGTLQIIHIYHEDYTIIRDTLWLKRDSKHNFIEYQLSKNKGTKPNVIRYFKGRIVDNNKTPVDDALITIENNHSKPKSFTTKINGIYYFKVDKGVSNEFKVNITKKNYIPLDTIIKVDTLHKVPSFQFKISKDVFSRKIMGQVLHRNMPLEDVHVKASGSIDNESEQQYTLPLDNKQNLPTGSFSIKTKESYSKNDSIKLTFSKINYATKTTVINLEELDSMPQYQYFDLKYANPITMLPYNNLSMYCSFPYTSIKEWYVSMEYSKRIKNFINERIGIGLNLGVISYDKTDELNTFIPNAIFSKEDTYTDILFGASTKYWFTNPGLRYFSSFSGFSIEYGLNSKAFYVYPFIGTRIFTNNIFAINVMTKYAYNQLDTVDYQFNPYGNATVENTKIWYNRFLINFGVSWTL